MNRPQERYEPRALPLQAPPNPYASNPYAAPQVQGVYEPAAQGPTRLDAPLYTSKHVALATFLGTPFGGAVILALNEHRLGRAGAALKSLLGGVVATGFLLTIGLVVPQGVPTLPLSIGSLVVMSQIAKSRQGAVVAQHFAAGGKRGSGWAAAGIGILALLVVMVPLIGILTAAELAAGN
jgi:hypothetical protein